MGLVQIEDSELQILRTERDTARSEAAAAKTEAETAKAEAVAATAAAEAAEAKATAAETAKATAEAKVTTLEETANQATLKDTRWKALGPGFIAKLGDFTKTRLEEQAKSFTDEQWEDRLKEVEETAGVKRDAEADGSAPDPLKDKKDDTVFTLDEIASAGSTLKPGTTTVVRDDERASVVGSLAGLFSK